jgi:hypothetical protein
MNVLIIPEDFRKDQYVLRPIVAAMLAALGKPRAKVRVMTDPLLGGIDKALDVASLRTEVLARYRGMVDLFLLVVDRDGRPGRGGALRGIEAALAADVPAGKCFYGEAAREEVEVWALAGVDLPSDWAWSAVRSDEHPKERYFEPLVAERGIADEPGEGRATLGSEAAGRLSRVLQRSPEVAHLSDRIAAWLTTKAPSGEPFLG